MPVRRGLRIIAGRAGNERKDPDCTLGIDPGAIKDQYAQPGLSGAQAMGEIQAPLVLGGVYLVAGLVALLVIQSRR